MITETATEFNGNVKYLLDAGKCLELFYTGDPIFILDTDTLSSLRNSIKMIHTIGYCDSRTVCISNPFVKITNPVINNCDKHIYNKRVTRCDLGIRNPIT